MRDANLDEISEDDLLKAIEQLAPPALPFGVVPPEEVGYFTSRVYGVFADAGVSPSEKLVDGLVEILCEEYVAFHEDFIAANLNRT